METWKIVIGIVVLFALGLLVFFDQYCREKYDHAFLSKRALCISMAAVAFFIGGDLYRQLPDRPPNELFAVSWSLFVVSAAIFVYLVVANVKATNYWMGLGGSAIHTLTGFRRYTCAGVIGRMLSVDGAVAAVLPPGGDRA